MSLFGISDNFHSTNWLLRTIISNITRAFFLYHYIVLSFYNPPWDSDISLSYTTRAKKERKVENKEVFRDSFQSLRSSLRFCVSVSVCISYFKHASSLSFFFYFFFFFLSLFIKGTGCLERNARLQKFQHRVAIECFQAPFGRVTSHSRDKLKLSYLNFSQRTTFSPLVVKKKATVK